MTRERAKERESSRIAEEKRTFRRFTRATRDTMTRRTRMHETKFSLDAIATIVWVCSEPSTACASCCATCDRTHCKLERARQRPSEMMAMSYSFAHTERERNENRENKHGFDGCSIRRRLSYWVKHRKRTDVRPTTFVRSYLICYKTKSTNREFIYWILYLSFTVYGKCVLNNNK